MAAMCLFYCHLTFAVKSMILASLKYSALVVSILLSPYSHIVRHAKLIRPRLNEFSDDIRNCSLRKQPSTSLNGN